ncbi:SDR family oxidoreductase [Bradyrhizobium sp. Leo121]|uniref:SDR family NAD(P)-dependent oxidoreductase n=1 Tax=Bradyrhizobium sp. Leo121 TaxID=1571195 RepID=UPI00102A0E21|nr:SDR family oxidoreductase [Bradyrhizobium sp. Leo121]RZN22872.1 short-chain dehydrogenase [Bradyrhizobium sp. Leo121]
MMLKDKVAVIYGAGGAVGGAVARAFAREGAKLFLTGRNRASVEAVAKEIAFDGAAVQTAEVDALEEGAISRHLQSVIDEAGRIDISFNAVGIPNTNLQGVPLVDLALDQFSRPIVTYTETYLLTARQAARWMVKRKSGVIMTVTSTPSRTGIPMMGGVGPAMAAVEALTRNFSAELARDGVRVVGLRPLGMPDSGTIREVYGLHAKAWGISWDQFHDLIASRTHTRRLTTLAEMANAAAFIASDQASAMTGTIVNMSLGALDD